MAPTSAAGRVESWDVKSPKWVDLMPGNQYAISLTNQSDTAEVNTGKLTIEGADADPADPLCRPGTWGPMMVGPDCASPIGSVPVEAEYDFAEHPMAPRQCCTFAFPCPKRFMRVVGAPATVDVHLVVTCLKRTGMGGTDPTAWPFGLQDMPPQLFSADAQQAPAPQPGQTRAPPPRQPAPPPGRRVPAE